MKLILMLALCSPVPLYSATITVDPSYPNGGAISPQQLSADVMTIVNRLFDNEKSPLNRPIEVRFRAGQPPQIVVPTSGNVVIYLSALGGRYAQYVYQLAHELAHFMFDPRRSNGAIETLCAALAYEVLHQMADLWATASVPAMQSYARNFEVYMSMNDAERLPYLPLQIRAFVEKRDVDAVRKILVAEPLLLGSLTLEDLNSETSRSWQTVAARLLRADKVDWRRFAGIARCTNPPPIEDSGYKVLPLVGSQCLAGVTEELSRFTAILP